MRDGVARSRAIASEVIGMGQNPEYVLSPSARINRSSPGRQLTLHAGLGNTRASFPLEAKLEAEFVQMFLRLSTPADRGLIVDHVSEFLEVDPGSAEAVVKFLIENEILVSVDAARMLEQCVRTWSRYGWKDPAIFHLATFGQPFDPDNTGKAAYDEFYAEILDDDSVIAQPPTNIERVPLAGTSPLRFAERAAPIASMDGVLAGTKPVYAYLDPSITLEDAFHIVDPVFKSRRRADSGLGEIVFKSFPSGGARHPLEVYLVVKKVPDAPSGVYHFSAANRTLTMVADEQLARKIDSACFLKRGVQSSNIAVVVTCRWIRHIWKYRYARSYRMIMMEIGHAVQSLNLSASASGYELYYCPSMDDEKLTEICALSDPLDEGPVIVLALGKNGITAEDYHERFDVEPR